MRKIYLKVKKQIFKIKYQYIFDRKQSPLFYGC